MPIKKADGSPGLLATCELGDAIKDFPDLTDAIEKYKDDLPLMNVCTPLQRRTCRTDCRIFWMFFR
jgi:hypothetical protein